MTRTSGIATISRALAAAVLAFAGHSAHADIVFDRSPDGTASPLLIDNLLNTTNPGLPQWYGERFSLSTATSITGMDVFGRVQPVSAVGQKVLLRIWSDASNEPQDLVYREELVVSELDTDGTLSAPNLRRRFAALDKPFLAAANTTYWIGMAGLTNVNYLPQATFVNADDGSMWLGRWGDSFSGFAPVGDMAFRLHGAAAALPEPGAGLLAAAALLALAVVPRRRAQSAAQAPG